jgi:hypothetical protein
VDRKTGRKKVEREDRTRDVQPGKKYRGKKEWER